MRINNQQFGEIEYKEEHLLNFKPGIAGFENLNRFLLLKTDDALFYWLNSVENPDICFPLIGLRLIDDNYPSPDNYEPFGIVTINKDALRTTINLKAPVYINQDEKKGSRKYWTRRDILSGIFFSRKMGVKDADIDQETGRGNNYKFWYQDQDFVYRR